MLPFLASIKTYLYAAAAAALVALIATILIQNARLDAKDQQLSGLETALTSYQAALRSSRDQVSELEAARVLDSETMLKLEEWLTKNRTKADTVKADQDRLKKDDEPTKTFLAVPTPDALRRLLDAEDGVADHP